MRILRAMLYQLMLLDSGFQMNASMPITLVLLTIRLDDTNPRFLGHVNSEAKETVIQDIPGCHSRTRNSRRKDGTTKT